MDKIGDKCDTFKCDVCVEEIRKANKRMLMKVHERNEDDDDDDDEDDVSGRH